MENTIENKAKFFALYLNIRGAVFRKGFRNRDNINPNGLDENDVLELTPLSQITDEDAIELAKSNPWSDYHEAEDVQPYVDHVKDFLKYPNQLTLNVVDKIRELGYALPWNGITVEKMIEYNWIKLK